MYLILEVRLKMVQVELGLGLGTLVGVRQMAMMGMELGKLTREGGGAGVW